MTRNKTEREALPITTITIPGEKPGLAVWARDFLKIPKAIQIIGGKGKLYGKPGALITFREIYADQLIRDPQEGDAVLQWQMLLPNDGQTRWRIKESPPLAALSQYLNEDELRSLNLALQTNYFLALNETAIEMLAKEQV